MISPSSSPTKDKAVRNISSLSEYTDDSDDDVLDLETDGLVLASTAPNGNGRAFLYNPIRFDNEERLRCEFRFAKNDFKLYTDEGQFLMSAQRGSKLSNIGGTNINIFSNDRSEIDAAFLARISGNFIGSEFNYYDSEKKIFKDEKAQQLAGIRYKTTLMENIPRQMIVCVPRVHPVSNQAVLWRNGLMKQFHTGSRSGMHIMHSKEPEWDSRLESYCLDFDGRVNEPDVANFQLVMGNDPNPIIIFGRIDQKSFCCDFRFPLSPIQAFSIAISAIHSKLICE